MEPIIYKPSIYKGAGIYKAGANGGGVNIEQKLTLRDILANIDEGKLYCFDTSRYIMCRTNNIDLVSMNSGHFHYELVCNGYASDNSSVSIGEFQTNNSDVIYFVSLYLHSNELSIVHQKPGESAFIWDNIDANYTLGQKVIIDIIVNSGIVNVRVKYDDTDVCNINIPLSEMNLSNAPLNLGGLRFYIDGYGLCGEIYLFNSYIEINDNLVWGVKT